MVEVINPLGVGSQTLQQSFDNGRTMTAGNFNVGVFDSANGISVENTSTLDKVTLETTRLTLTKNSFGLKTTNVLQAITPTANRTIRFPDADGTIALQTYKSYVALLTQTETGAPTTTVLENTLGGNIVWTRTNTGRYEGTLSNAFTLNKTFVKINPFDDSLNKIASSKVDANSVSIKTYSADETAFLDTVLFKTEIEIRVYN
jgi:hypothetical protein